MNSVKAEELALITAIIINEDMLGGSVFATFDLAYKLANDFYESHFAHWTEDFAGLDYDEAVIAFVNDKKHIMRLINNDK